MCFECTSVLGQWNAARCLLIDKRTRRSHYLEEADLQLGAIIGGSLRPAFNIFLVVFAFSPHEPNKLSAAQPHLREASSTGADRPPGNEPRDRVAQRLGGAGAAGDAGRGAGRGQDAADRHSRVRASRRRPRRAGRSHAGSSSQPDPLSLSRRRSCCAL